MNNEYLFKCIAFLDHPHPCKYMASATYNGLLMCCHSCERYETCKDRCKNMVHRCGKTAIERAEELPKETKKKKKPKFMVVQYDLFDNEVAVYNSITEAAAAVGVHVSHIADVSKGIGKTAGGFKWRRKYE